jgi:predicted phosphodiesterase
MTSRQTIQVIGDVHGNAHALRAALDHAHDADRLVFIGDLLTYGTDVDEVLDLALDAQRRRGAVIIRGNHDRLYDGLVTHGRSSYAAGLPAWIRESVERTHSALDTTRWRAIDFVEELWMDDVLFAHAGPWPVGDDTYINSSADHAVASEALARRNASAGVFGHTHRARLYIPNESQPRMGAVEWSGQRDRARPVVVNVGAVGQPRDRDRHVWRARVTIDRMLLGVSLHPLTYDRDAHIARITAGAFSVPTLARLLSFHGAAVGR